MNKKVRVRFAPSPTGGLHIGGVRTALYNYLFAKKYGGDFILRIEDTDQTRFVEGAEEYIIESLAWLGITFDEGTHVGGPHAPYRQSERKNIYRQYAESLIEKGYAYYAFDTPEELEQMRERLKAAKVASPQYNSITRNSMKNSLTLPADEVKARIANGEPYVIRLKVPRKEEIRLYDEIRGWVVVQSHQIDDKVLLKSDGMPTYHLANVVDDYLMKITHVIRGEEWLPSAPLHVLLYRYLDWEEVMPKFAHLPLILRPDGNGKLKKRESGGILTFPLSWHDPITNEDYLGYREAGFLPEAVINFLAFLGWNPGTDQEIFSIQDLIQSFSLERIGKSGARFDAEKVKWFNSVYIRSTDTQKLLPLVKNALSQRNVTGFSDEYISRVIDLMKDRVVTIPDFYGLATYFYQEFDQYDEAMKQKQANAENIQHWQALLPQLKNLNIWDATTIDRIIHDYAEINKVKIGKILPTLRLMITGVSFGPSVPEIMALIGKEKSIQRIEKALLLWTQPTG
ncbi:MAG: glutamate--tRNA ligase [Bacteroidia bacterium]|nr:glutamate--tRNA ligase [Bacteroidia bacterium]MDW8345909.1 glutamate--tRNA ligase [Bacteroidia bacterium]